MTFEGASRNRFRASILGGRNASPVVSDKLARVDQSAEGLDQVPVPRSETRRENHRGGDRHRLNQQQAVVRAGGTTREVTLINLSGGGAMVEGPVTARLWDKLTLVLGDFGEVECAVRWMRGNRLGLEFAHETRIDCDAATLDQMLKDVIRKSFPESSDIVADDAVPFDDAAPAKSQDHKRQEVRHPLIWSGRIHQDGGTVAARLRNISTHGALIQSSLPFEEGSEVTLDLGDSGSIAATVCWSRGDQTGLSFVEPFDVRSLSRSRPEVAPSTWTQPDYLRDDSIETSPWASQWGRLTIKELSRSLSGRRS
jgi:hypothetical protein